jgi:hypothetical protein
MKLTEAVALFAIIKILSMSLIVLAGCCIIATMLTVQLEGLQKRAILFRHRLGQKIKHLKK